MSSSNGLNLKLSYANSLSLEEYKIWRFWQSVNEACAQAFTNDKTNIMLCGEGFSQGSQTLVI